MLTREALFPAIHDPQVFGAIISAFIDLDWLGLAFDPDPDNYNPMSRPPRGQPTAEGQLAIQDGFRQVVEPPIQAKCIRLSEKQRTFLEYAVRPVRDREQPRDYAKRFAVRESVIRVQMAAFDQLQLMDIKRNCGTKA